VATYPKNVWIGEPPASPCPDHDCADDDPCGADPDPDPCFNSGLDTIHIPGYADGDVAAGGCEDCAASPWPLFNGVLVRTPVFESGEWLAWPGGPDGYPDCQWSGGGQVDGKEVELAVIWGDGQWLLGWLCWYEVEQRYLGVWVGYGSHDETTPLGTYTRNPGFPQCTPGPETLTLAAGSGI
jgi:hypothetical protein